MIVFLYTHITVWTVIRSPIPLLDIALCAIVDGAVWIMATFIVGIRCLICIHRIHLFIIMLILMSLRRFQLVFKNLIDNRLWDARVLEDASQQHEDV
jgi:hypothetical protein